MTATPARPWQLQLYQNVSPDFGGTWTRCNTTFTAWIAVLRFTPQLWTLLSMNAARNYSAPSISFSWREWCHVERVGRTATSRCFSCPHVRNCWRCYNWLSAWIGRGCRICPRAQVSLLDKTLHLGRNLAAARRPDAVFQWRGPESDQVGTFLVRPRGVGRGSLCRRWTTRPCLWVWLPRLRKLRNLRLTTARWQPHFSFVWEFRGSYFISSTSYLVTNGCNWQTVITQSLQKTDVVDV